ncbi:putative metabolite transport protein [Clavispora lusitaniae]|uniref:Metabolite transport protein n=1 Tax=Clavispora lusitaniae TaxID=36911 RepID=A0AA91Q149_CLALS|nr:putative metabolite transport protein [Clavispora lusitaniae]
MSSRDLPRSFTSWYKRFPDEITLNKKTVEETEDEKAVRKVQMKNLWPAFISGAGLFSDGYVNNSIGTVTTCLSLLYKEKYTHSNAISNIAAIAFAGTVIGQLSFGYISDHYARKGGMLVANVALIFFALLCAVATWGKTPEGTFAAVTTCRFFLGIAIGAEYPTSSVIASEFANQLPSGHRNRYFCWFTNSCIDLGFVISSFVPLVLLWIFSERHLTVVWRLTLALGAIPPISLFFMRRKMTNSEAYEKLNMKTVTNFPFWLTIKFYWFRLIVVSIIWFIYDFSAYSFSLYSSYILSVILPDSDIYKSWGWNVVFNLFYIPGTFLGGYCTDFFGPRLTLAVGLTCQAIVGFGMTAGYSHLKHHIAAFVVVFGIFTTLGEFGPGNNVGILAAKTSATPIRGQYYGIAAATGKVGAFVGTYIFPIILRKYKGDKGIQTAFYISSALCLFSAILTVFFVPSVDQEAINKEDVAYVNYLKSHGFDISNMGNGTVSEYVESESTEFDQKRSEAKVDTYSV